MRPYLSLKIAYRFLFNNHLGSFSTYASWLAIGGLSIGIASLMLTASIIRGFHDTISGKLSTIEGGQGRLSHIIEGSIDLSDLYIDSLVNDGNNYFSPFINGVALLRFGSTVEGVIFEGLLRPPPILSNISNISLDPGNIIIGKGISSLLKINIGDKVYLQGLPADKKLSNIPSLKSFIVKDIFYTGLQEYDNALVYISINDANSILLSDENEVSGLIYNNSKSPMSQLDVKYPYYYQTWKEKHALLFEWISLQRWPAYLMFGLISLVGLVNLIAALAMIIIEKTNQIGILLAQGIPRLVLKKVFIIQGGIIGLIGGIIGGVISIILIMLQLKFSILEIPSDIYFMDQIPFSFDYSIFLLMLFLSFSLAIMISWIPINRISTFKPTNALRYE
ncbi:MAG: ABC transporter permease [Candidatus Neomarinimicrobiota bacterium]